MFKSTTTLENSPTFKPLGFSLLLGKTYAPTSIIHIGTIGTTGVYLSLTAPG